MLNLVYTKFHISVHNTECRYSENRCAECRGAEKKNLENIFWLEKHNKILTIFVLCRIANISKFNQEILSKYVP